MSARMTVTLYTEEQEHVGPRASRIAVDVDVSDPKANVLLTIDGSLYEIDRAKWNYLCRMTGEEVR